MHQIELPANVVEGELARLIPIAKDSAKETKATSVILSALMSVSEFGRNMLAGIDAPSTKTTSISCYTEVVFKSGATKEPCRPDGMIVATVGNRKWTALVEAKVGNTELDTKQIETYLELARKYGLDAVITISNQFAPLPTHHPVKINGHKLRGVQLYHWSWSALLSEAIMLIKNKGVSDPEQAYILTEVTRYINNKDTKVLSTVSMGKNWKKLCEDIRDNGTINLPAGELCTVVDDWHQIGRFLALELSTATGANVSVFMKHAHKSDPVARANADVKVLQSEHDLFTELNIPHAAARLHVCADVARRVLEVSMSLKAPQDKKRSSACVTWLLKQLNKCEDESLIIKVTFGKPTLNTSKPLKLVREEPSVLLPDDSSIIPSWFEIKRVSDNVTRFMGQKTFVEDLRQLVVSFYGDVGENLTAWIPPAPQVKDDNRTSAASSPKTPQPTDQNLVIAENKPSQSDGMLRGLLSRLPLN